MSELQFVVLTLAINLIVGLLAWYFNRPKGIRLQSVNVRDNPLGAHFQNMRGDPAHIQLEQCRLGRFTTSSFLEAFDTASQAQKDGMPFPIYRSYNLEPRPDHPKYNSAEAVFNEIWKVGQQNTAVYWNLSCEVDLTDWLYQLYIDLIDLMISRNMVIGVVFSNAAYLPSYWDTQGNHYVKVANARKYLQKMWDVRHVKNSAGHPAFIHGDHFYTAGFWNAFCNAGEFLTTRNFMSALSNRWKTGEYAIDWSLPQWHFNKIQAIKDALGWKWDHSIRKWVPKDPANPPTADLPWMIITEELFGSMSIPALLNYFPQWAETAPYGRDIRGYRANTRQWELWYGMTAGKVLTLMRQMVWRYIYEPLGVVLGTTHFSAGDTGGWAADNTTGDKDYWDSVLLVRENVPYFTGQGEPPVIIKPEFVGVFRLTGGNLRMRQEPNIEAPVITTVPDGTLVLASEPVVGWRYVKRETLNPPETFEGWMSNDVAGITFEVEPPNPPVDPPIEGTLEERVKFLEELIDAIESGLVVRFGMLEDEVETHRVTINELKSALSASETQRKLLQGLVQKIIDWKNTPLT